jgi:predicted transposase/invertase (TIGR01784 family)
MLLVKRLSELLPYWQFSICRDIIFSRAYKKESGDDGVFNMKKMLVKNDFIFQKIFGQNEHKEILLGLLNAILHLQADQKLVDIEIIENTKLSTEYPGDRVGIVDIRAKMLTGEQINIEIQLANKYDMERRTLFYWSKIYTEQLKSGEPFTLLKKTIAINIVDFNYINLEPYHTTFHLRENNQPDYQLTDVLEIHFIELPKFRKAKPDLSKPLDCWLLFIEDSPEEVRQMIRDIDPVIAKAEAVLENLGSLDEVRRYYELREKEIHDEITRMTGAREEGREEGKIEGKIEGRLEGKLEMAKNFLLMGLDVGAVAKAAELPAEEILKLQKSLQH